mmetsp:Transcript_31090/g.99790  ORF Transcript_31090/g.99790 Transcript_31090/m.99790 type:complete len:246 (+) Transcript_31090:475-1212(+)
MQTHGEMWMSILPKETGPIAGGAADPEATEGELAGVTEATGEAFKTMIETMMEASLLLHRRTGIMKVDQPITAILGIEVFEKAFFTGSTRGHRILSSIGEPRRDHRSMTTKIREGQRRKTNLLGAGRRLEIWTGRLGLFLTFHEDMTMRRGGGQDGLTHEGLLPRMTSDPGTIDPCLRPGSAEVESAIPATETQPIEIAIEAMGEAEPSTSHRMRGMPTGQEIALPASPRIVATLIPGPANPSVC